MKCKSCNSTEITEKTSEYKGDYTKETYYCKDCGTEGTKFYDKIYIIKRNE